MTENDPGKWPEGLALALDTLKPIMTGSYAAVEQARKRMWRARDEFNLCQRQLNAAQMELETAEREYDDCGKYMGLVWESFKDEVMKIPLTDSAPPLVVGEPLEQP